MEGNKKRTTKVRHLVHLSVVVTCEVHFFQMYPDVEPVWGRKGINPNSFRCARHGIGNNIIIVP